MPASQTNQELYDGAVANKNYAEAAYIKRVSEYQAERGIVWNLRKSLLSANFAEMLCVIYALLLGCTSFRHTYAPLRFGALHLRQYDQNQFRWRKHVFFLDKKAPLVAKGMGAYIAFCLVLKGFSTETTYLSPASRGDSF
jgi:hypothetical protein